MGPGKRTEADGKGCWNEGESGARRDEKATVWQNVGGRAKFDWNPFARQLSRFVAWWTFPSSFRPSIALSVWTDGLARFACPVVLPRGSGSESSTQNLWPMTVACKFLCVLLQPFTPSSVGLVWYPAVPDLSFANGVYALFDPPSLFFFFLSWCVGRSGSAWPVKATWPLARPSFRTLWRYS